MNKQIHEQTAILEPQRIQRSHNKLSKIQKKGQVNK